MLNTKDFKYLLLIKNDVSLLYHKIKRVIYKMMLDKTSRYTEYINRIMCKFIDNTLK